MSLVIEVLDELPRKTFRSNMTHINHGFEHFFHPYNKALPEFEALYLFSILNNLSLNALFTTQLIIIHNYTDYSPYSLLFTCDVLFIPCVNVADSSIVCRLLSVCCFSIKLMTFAMSFSYPRSNILFEIQAIYNCVSMCSRMTNIYTGKQPIIAAILRFSLLIF